MPKFYTCTCKSYGCKDKPVDYQMKRTHYRKDLRLQTSTSQVIHHGLVAPHVLREPPPLTPPYPIRGPLIPPRLEFPDPPPISPSAVEQEMLDHGILMQEDLDLQVHGSELPNLGLNFHSPEALIEAVDHYEAYNAITAAGAQPLSAYHAHNLPMDPEECEVRHGMERLLKEIQRQQAVMDVMDEEIPDVDFGADETLDLPDDDTTHQSTSEDDPDPFHSEHDYLRSGTSFQDLSSQPIYLIVVYMMTTWLHLQWHLPCAACNAVLSILSFLLLALCPTLAPPFVTLPSAMKVLGLDLPIHKLPSRPLCRDVFPPAGSLHTQDECVPCKAALFLPSQTKRGMLRCKTTPCVKYPYLPLSEQIRSMLTIPGVEDSLDEWCTRTRSPGVYMDIFDGAICRAKLKAPDSSLFFANGPQDQHGPSDELQISVNLGIDWFSYIWSNIAPSHSSCPMSFSICNLPPEYRRYRTSNLMLTSILPGPKEQSPDQIQRFLWPIISDLLCLWQHSIRVPMPSSPGGRLTRVVLVTVVCNKPAAHKIGGFSSHSHTNFCHNCWISQAQKDKAAAFVPDAFRAHTNAEQRELGQQYLRLTTATARKAFVKDWIVIDPMHNLFLGLAKTHFYNIWVQGKILHLNHELRIFHNILADFEIPTSCGKLPTDISIPARGSLTADQWLLLATVYGPIAAMKAQQDGSLTDHVALIAKQESEKTSNEEKKKADAQALKDARSRGKEADAAEKARIAVEKVAAEEAKKTEKLRVAEEKKAKKARGTELKQVSAMRFSFFPAYNLYFELAKSKGNPTLSADHVLENAAPDNYNADVPGEGIGEQDEADSKCILHPDDPSNFLKLCAAIHLLIKHTITDQEISSADSLLRQYCTELIQLYGSGCLKPNHHYATHTSQYVRNFGPLSGFWTFLFERLNKILKSFKTNNHGDRELETTLFNEFHRMCQSSRLTPDESLGRKVSDIMLKASAEERGTVAGLAALSNDLNEAHGEDVIYGLSPRRQRKALPHETYKALAHMISLWTPDTPIHCHNHRPATAHSIALDRMAMFFENSSLVRVLLPRQNNQPAVDAYGEILEVFCFSQDIHHQGQSMYFARMRWFKRWDGEREGIWQTFGHCVGVRLWELEEYISLDMELPTLIDPTYIQNHVALKMVSVGPNQMNVWATVDLVKARSPNITNFDI
ncbi:hypothetical protein M404DRAFT_29181 [Pisolithus tinctorius Marx 270]|uniref:Uncharacterized protein n=1 Tax=Pisolithus tinctorius Marx 270 TaxID=870435 RepID=A0A0C3NJ14_PISTI|nr:hypothetical protein M404DRAFT_29181 [Pisolithus tinctorius Marx 270]